MERNAVVVDAVFGEGIKDAQRLTRLVLQPIQKIFDASTSTGFVVLLVRSHTSCQHFLDLPQSNRCGYTLLGIPKPILDITGELRKAVDEAKKNEQPKDQK
jgi:hypothetical protein